MEIAKIAAENHPTVYANACTAIIECANLDECKGWADKAAAIAEYAKQAQDDTLLKMAMRIKLRATRRAGELINAIPTNQGARNDLGTEPTRRRTVQESGISERQQKQYQRVANVPEDDFEAQINSDSVPTVTAMAEQGKKDLLQKMNATKDFPMYWNGALNRFIDECKKNEPSGFKFYDQEAEIKSRVRALVKYLGKVL